MKFLITEEQEHRLIEELLKDRFPEIISVEFKRKTALLASENMRKHVYTLISVICDTNGVLTGNKINENPRRKIFRFLEDTVGLDLTSYGSKWELDVFEIFLKIV